MTKKEPLAPFLFSSFPYRFNLVDSGSNAALGVPCAGANPYLGIVNTMTINWILLIIGGLFETGFAISLGKAQQASGKSLVLWLSLFIVCVAISMYLLFKAMGGEKAIPVGTAYAVWGAIGAVGTVTAGIVWFQEPVTFWRMFFLSTLVISVIGLQVVSSTPSI